VKCQDREKYALFFEQGTGKTATAINILRSIYVKKQRILRTLIFAPRIVVPNWKREFGVHSKIPQDQIWSLTGSGKKRWHTVSDEGFTDSRNPRGRIFITNYEALLMNDLYTLLDKWKPEVIILDESHKCKNIRSKRTKKMIKLSDHADYRYLLSGTPITNDLMDVFAQYKIMDGGKTFGSNYIGFRRQYFIDLNAGMPTHRYFPNWKVREEMVQKMNVRIQRTSMRIKKEECLDLPPLVRQVIPVELVGKQATHYKKMKREYLAYVEDRGACVAQLAITKALRLQQIISGFIRIESEEGGVEDVIYEKNPRIEALRDLLKDLTPNHKVIVWAVFKMNYAAIRKVCEEEGIKYVEVHGQVSDKEKDKNVEEFNNNDEVRVFIGNPSSGGIGINLVVSDISIFYSRNFSLEADLQAEARNHRGGSEVHKKVTRIDLVAKDTLDEEIMEALARKEKISEDVLTRMIVNE
jgi:SNF2 family DNA or RNA helicase